jgi:hypothetical protein
MKRIALYALFLVGCAGVSRSCSSCVAEDFGADWIIVQYKMDGSVLRCWKMTNVGVVNEPSSDGIYWKGSSGHLVHISGWYNRVQVRNGDWAGAAKDLGVDLALCSDK